MLDCGGDPCASALSRSEIKCVGGEGQKDRQVDLQGAATIHAGVDDRLVGPSVSGDADGAPFTFSASYSGTGSASVASNGDLTAGNNSTGDLTVTTQDSAGNISSSFTFHLWVDGNGGAATDSHTFASLTGSNIGDGMGGADTITGSDVTDYLIGDNQNDTLRGNGGADWLFGGGGNDHFVFAAVADSTSAAHDSILGETTALLNTNGALAAGIHTNPDGDIIDLHLIDADPGVGGDQAFIFDAGQNAGTVAGHVTWNQCHRHG
jgi:Ca2+-binding RTX toxin-like protein